MSGLDPHTPTPGPPETGWGTVDFMTLPNPLMVPMNPRCIAGVRFPAVSVLETNPWVWDTRECAQGGTMTYRPSSGTFASSSLTFNGSRTIVQKSAGCHTPSPPRLYGFG